MKTVNVIFSVFIILFSLGCSQDTSQRVTMLEEKISILARGFGNEAKGVYTNIGDEIQDLDDRLKKLKAVSRDLEIKMGNAEVRINESVQNTVFSLESRVENLEMRASYLEENL